MAPVCSDAALSAEVMDHLPLGVIALVVFVVLALGVALAVRRARAEGPRSSSRWPFSLRRPLSEPEQVLYYRLCRALPDHMVLAQVGLSRFLAVRRGHDARAWYNRINRMSIDFLVCTRAAEVVAAIELDDASHQRPDRASADQKKQTALRAAGVRLLRYNVGAMPSEAELAAAIRGGAQAGAQRGTAAATPLDLPTQPATL